MDSEQNNLDLNSSDARAKIRLFHHSALYCWLLISFFIAHSATAENIPLFQAKPHSMEWLLTDHEGASKFRRGKSCQSCHGEDEESMSASPIRNLDITLEKVDDTLKLTYAFVGPSHIILSAMFDAGAAKAFQRGGCWAACHNDIIGMPENKKHGKYLGQTRAKMAKQGGGDVLKALKTIDAMRSSNNFVKIWSIELNDDQVVNEFNGSILEDKSQQKVELPANVDRSGENWRVTVTYDLPADGTAVGFALLQKSEAETAHYVSLPFSIVYSDGGINLEAE